MGLLVAGVLVGLKLDSRLVKRLGPSALAAGLLQVMLTAGVAFVIARLGGLEAVQALSVGAAMAFSSTVIVVKLLTDRRELEQLHGRIALGILIVQDIVVVGLMIALASFDPTEQSSLAAQLVTVMLRGALLLGGVALAARFLLPRLTHLLARQGELLVLASVTWAVALAAIAIWQPAPTWRAARST